MPPRRAAVSVLVLATALLGAGCGSDFRVIEKSMEPTIASGDLVRLDERTYERRPPAVDDIVALRAPRGAERDECGVLPAPDQPCPRPTPELSEELSVVKRIVAGPGQRVSIDEDGAAVVDGVRRAEEFLQLCARECALPRAIRIPEGHWFVLGDNRPYSADSRYWGPVPTRALEGRVEPARSLADR